MPITPRNVSRLQPVWTYRTGDARADNRSQIQCNPLIIDGILYGTSAQLKLFALDAALERWPARSLEEPVRVASVVSPDGDRVVG